MKLKLIINKMLALVLLWALVGVVDSLSCIGLDGLAITCQSDVGWFSDGQHCRAGYYTAYPPGYLVAVECFLCEKGTCQPKATVSIYNYPPCPTCPANTYMPNKGATACLACSVTACDAVTGGRTANTPCLPGTYSSTGTGIACPSCPAGQVVSTSGAKSCKYCPEAKQQPNSAKTACESCPAGTYCSWNCDVCAKCTNTHTNAVFISNAVFSYECEFRCNAGYYRTYSWDQGCMPCGFGRYAKADHPNYVACYACAYADITGTACSVGNYPTLSNTCVVTKCTACSNLPASDYYYSTTSDQNYYSTAAITTEVSLAI